VPYDPNWVLSVDGTDIAARRSFGISTASTPLRRASANSGTTRRPVERARHRTQVALGRSDLHRLEDPGSAARVRSYAVDDLIVLPAVVSDDAPGGGGNVIRRAIPALIVVIAGCPCCDRP
jgi:hypothetical protein